MDIFDGKKRENKYTAHSCLEHKARTIKGKLEKVTDKEKGWQANAKK